MRKHISSTSSPTFIILGAGAMGSLFGALLSEKYSAMLISRKEHVKKIKENGLLLSGSVEKTYTISAATSIKKIATNTIILLAMKVHDSKTALESIKTKVKKDTIIVILQNGLGQEQDLQKLVSCPVIRVVTERGATFRAPGHIRCIEDFPTYIEKGGEGIAHYFNSVGITTKVVDDIRRYEWEKLMINCVINSCGSILRVPNNQLNQKSLEPIKKAIVDECVLVAIADGYTFNYDILAKVNRFIKKSVNINSTLQDLQKGKQTEIEYLNGAIVRLGKKYGIKTPVNETLYYLVKSIETLSSLTTPGVEEERSDGKTPGVNKLK